MGSTNNIYVSSSNFVYRSDDFGLTFNQLGNTPMAPTSLAVSADGTKIYSIGIYSTGVWISTNSGSSFTMNTNSGLNMVNIFDVAVDQAGNIYLASSNGLFVSTNAGASFSSKTTTHGLASNDLRTIGLDSSGKIFVGGLSGGVSISSDNASTFSHSAAGFENDSIVGLFVDSSHRVYAATAGGELGISVDGGVTFSSKKLGGNIRKPFITNEGIILAPTSNGLQVSLDGGENWVSCTAMNGLPNNDVLAVRKVGSKVFVGVNGSGISIADF